MKITKSITLTDAEEMMIKEYPSLGIYPSNFTSKVMEMITGLDCLTRYTKVELANHFSTNECLLITDALNGVIYNPTISPNMVIVDATEQGIVFNKLDIKWNVNKDDLLERLNNLTEFQSFTMILNAFTFYQKMNDSHPGANNDSLEETLEENIRRIFLTNR